MVLDKPKRPRCITVSEKGSLSFLRRNQPCFVVAFYVVISFASLLRSRERSTSRVMEGKSTFPVCIWGHNFSPSPPPNQKNSQRANHVISLFDHVLSFGCCAISRTFGCRGSLLWTVADKFLLLSSKLVLNIADMSSPNMYDFSYEQKAVVWVRVVYPWSSPTKTRAVFCWINQRRKCVVSLCWPRVLCANYVS